MLHFLILFVLAGVAAPRGGHAQDSAAVAAPGASPRAVQPSVDSSRRRADSLFARGEAYRGRQRFDSARLSYEASIHADPAAPSATESFNRLKSLPLTALDRDPFAVVHSLSRVGFDAEARAELKKVLAANPDRPVPADLRHLTPSGIEWWRDLRRTWEMTGRQVLEILSVFLVLGLAAWWLLQFLLGKPLLQITDFQGTPGSGDKANGEPDGTQFSALVETYLKQLSAGAPLGRGPVNGPAEPASLPVDLQGLVPGGVPLLSAVVSLMARLNPRKVLRIHGLLLPPGPQGRGVMLRLTEGDGVVDSITLWEHQFLSAKALQDLSARVPTWQFLAHSAAAWVLFRAGDVQPRLRETKPFRALGTTRWRSYALFSAGVRLETYRLLAHAEKAYWEALRDDPSNLGARVNLGTVLMDRSRPAPAIRQLQQVSVDALKAKEFAVGYLARYREAVAWHQLGELEPANDIARWTQARSVSEPLLAEIDTTRKQSAGITPALRRTLDELYPTVKVLDAGLRASLGIPSDELGGDLGVEFADLPVGHTQHNLALTYVILAQKAGSKPVQQEPWLDRALEHLKFAFCLEPHRAGVVASDPSFAPLRRAPGVAERFAKLLQEYGVAADPGSSLEQVAIIGTYAGALAQAGIKDAAALHARCGTVAGRLGLAKALGVTRQTVERWAGVAGLLALSEVDPRAVNALCRAGIDSCAALGRCSPGDLTARLEHLAVAAGETDRHEFFTVAAWIDLARAR
jgi:tetratricopeptide (TPR) repeat protein